MTPVEVMKWCEDNWAMIKEQHITLANIKALLVQCSNTKAVPNKTNGVGCLLALIKENEEEEEEEEQEEEDVEKRSLIRRGKK